MAVQTDGVPRALFMCSEDVKNYGDFFTDLYQGKTIKPWTIICVMQMFTLPGDLWLGEDEYLGAVICFTQDTEIRWMWLDYEWNFVISESSEEVQELMVGDVLRHEFRTLTWAPKSGWQLMGDEKLVFNERPQYVLEVYVPPRNK